MIFQRIAPKEYNRKISTSLRCYTTCAVSTFSSIPYLVSDHHRDIYHPRHPLPPITPKPTKDKPHRPIPIPYPHPQPDPMPHPKPTPMPCPYPKDDPNPIPYPYPYPYPMPYPLYPL